MRAPLPSREQLLAGYGFPLDDFQIRALDALDAGQSVLVAAPTGSGKTVVAEYAVARAVAAGNRAFYTTPIKALSNQKFADLVRIHGADRVGLLTGDNAINGDAPVVVMTTEVLRNMIYARSSALDALSVVVLDEVHFLQDAYRGPVWEEVIIHLRRDVRLVCLSATVSNAEELTEWMTTVRGPTAPIIEERRPVTLENLYMVGDRTSDRVHLLPTLVDGRPNGEAARLDAEALRGGRTGGPGGPGGEATYGSAAFAPSGYPGYGNGNGKGASGANRYRQARRKLYTPRRVEVVERLERERMLPAIYFIFSRNACSEAAAHCLDAGVRLTTGPERDAIREIVDRHLDGLDAADLAVLGYARWRAALEAGVAAHHAGLVPPFKEAVEECFVEGLVKVVFATETLAVGINMPARSVVIEKLSKFTGERHQFLTPGEYTQLTGRAGRRGIDDIGHAVVLWSPFVTFDQVAALAASRSFTLTSAFRPTYNMAANLVRSYAPDQARHLLNLSFAQYQTDREVVRLETRLERREAALTDLRRQATSPYGDLEEFRALVAARSITAPPRANEGELDLALTRLRPGDVLVLDKGRFTGRAVVLTSSRRNGAAKVRVVTPGRQTLLLGTADFDAVPRAVARLDLPQPFAPNRRDFQREVARLLERVRLDPGLEKAAARHARRRGDHDGERDDRGPGDGPLEHPVQEDPDLALRLKAAAAAERVEREVAELRERVKGRAESIARRFDRVLGVLTSWGYLDGWALTDAGERLARLFHESDLLVAEALRTGLLDDLDPASLAGLVSCFTYEHRSPEPPLAPWFPTAEARQRWEGIRMLGEELRRVEDLAGLPLTREPEPSFAATAWAWAAGESFAAVVEEEELTGGDFVRNVKQLIDLLRQIGDVAASAATRRAARAASDALFRGVVAASSLVDSGADRGAESGADAGAESGADAGAESGADAGADAGPGAGGDVDRGADTSPGAGTDVDGP